MDNITKGKWKIYNCGDGYYEIHDKSGQVIAAISGTDVEAEANAHLIAAAVNACKEINPDNPMAVAESTSDMYEALKGLEPMLVSLGNGKTIVHPTMMGIAVNGLQALAKAGGK